MADFITQSKGKVLDEMYVPLEAAAKDFEKAIAKIDRLRPDVVFSTVVGNSTAIFYEAYRRAGFDSAKMPIASLTTSEAEVAEMSTEAAEGHITAAPFFEVLATPAARSFVGAYKLRYGPDAPVTAGAEAAYFQVHIAAGARGRAGPDDPERILPELREAEFDAPQGRVRIDPTNNHTYLWPRVARLDARGSFQMIWNPGVRVKPDPYCIVPSLDDWSADGLQQMHA
jgi:branched-chain amino acid transport system substrate-binding protein